MKKLYILLSDTAYYKTERSWLCKNRFNTLMAVTDLSLVGGEAYSFEGNL